MRRSPSATSSAVSAQPVDEVIVVDNGSTDQTAERAGGAGARVVAEPRRSRLPGGGDSGAR
jgi:glycosyltransferase involved in cell wall biosynthesis